MGSMNYEEFVEACKDFESMSSKFSDGWELVTVSEPTSSVYLKKKVSCVKKSVKYNPPGVADAAEQDKACEDGDEVVVLENGELSEIHDPSAVSEEGEGELLTYDYHIVYSIAHSVPVLYFNAYNSSGKLLTLDEIWDSIPETHKEQVLANRWESLTQQEHPLLGRPFFQLHPCGTAKLMTLALEKTGPQTISKKEGKYIASWLSMFGPVAGLVVPVEYFK
ncbi:autophagy-related 10 [Oratosquilla oratoria]|uniref:autophagy-related 10 n=1 Tax=Oratosquilla oratoria TaxID=337810 RepID=UPI003F762C52